MTNMTLTPSYDLTVRVTIDFPDGLTMEVPYTHGRKAHATTLLAKASVRESGAIGLVSITGRGRYLRKDGSVGAQEANLGWRVHLDPEDHARVVTALQDEANRVLNGAPQ